MTKEELLEKLIEIDNVDHEEGHFKADQLLLEYINDKDIRNAFNNINRWYS